MKLFGKYTFIILAVVLLSALVVVGCGSDEEVTPDDNSDGKVTPGDGSEDEELSGEIQIAGSTSVQPLSEMLAEAFMDSYPEVTVNIAGGGSGQGIKSADDGTADIGAASRGLKPDEPQLVTHRIAVDGIAVIVHKDNPVSDLTMEQVQKIYTGEITDWSEIGGEAGPITVYNREEGSGTRGAFHEIVVGEDNEMKADVIQNSNGAMRTALAGDPAGIAYISMGYLNDEVKGLKIDGVEPAKANVLNETYKVSRPYLYLTKSEPAGVVKAYIDFVLSEEGQEIVGMDYIPVN